MSYDQWLSTTPNQKEDPEPEESGTTCDKCGGPVLNSESYTLSADGEDYFFTHQRDCENECLICGIGSRKAGLGCCKIIWDDVGHQTICIPHKFLKGTYCAELPEL